MDVFCCFIATTTNSTRFSLSRQITAQKEKGREGGERTWGVSAVLCTDSHTTTHTHTQLTAVELVRVGVLGGLLVRSIGVGVGDAAGLAELAGARHVQDVDEEGRGGGGQDEAVLEVRVSN